MSFFENRKKQGLVVTGYVAVGILLMLLVTIWQYRQYTANYNAAIDGICMRLQTAYPELTGAEIMEVLDGGTQKTQTGFLEKYGVDSRRDSAVLENDRALRSCLVLEGMLVLALLLGMVLYLWLQGRYFGQQTRQTLSYLKRINAGDDSLRMQDSREGEMARLKSELYKTAITLREHAENSRKDKLLLKDALSDISHQLKTPITSLSISMENLENQPAMAPEKREAIIRRARRDVGSLKQMVQAILQLSKLEADVITFTRATTRIADIVEHAVEDVMALGELLGIQIEIAPESDTDAKMLCDAYWQTQALTNIVKNAVEHAAGRVSVRYFKYELYSEIVVENDGQPLCGEDMKNLFSRFYRGQNAAADSVGIGLALAKSIVEHDGGYILVDSEPPGDAGTEGITRFVLRY